MVLSLSNIIIVVLIGVCGWLAGKWLFKKDTEIEHRRRAAGRLAAKLSEMGFKELPEFFINYSVGDYSGMAYKLTEIARTMVSGEKAVLAELDDVFTKLLAIKLATQEGRFQVGTKLAEIEKLLAGPPAVVAPVAPVVAPVAPEAPVAPPVAPDAVAVTPAAIAALVNLVPPVVTVPDDFVVEFDDEEVEEDSDEEYEVDA